MLWNEVKNLVRREWTCEPKDRIRYGYMLYQGILGRCWRKMECQSARAEDGVRLGEVCLFVCCIFFFLSRESDGGAIFWTNPHPFRSCPFSVVPLISYHLICCLFKLKPPNRDNHRKAPYPRIPGTQQRIRRGWELNLDHAIVITRSL